MWTASRDAMPHCLLTHDALLILSLLANQTRTPHLLLFPSAMSGFDQICSGCVKAGDAIPAAANSGTETSVGGYPCYVVGSGSKAIILCTDIFGWRFPNARAVSEQYAAAGFTVLIPDYIAEPADINKMADFMANFGEWLKRNPLSRDTAIAKAVATEAATKYSSVQAVGFCLGARPAVDLVAAGLVRAAVVFHPTFMQESDVATIGVPMQFNCASTDNLFTPQLRAAFETGLKDKPVTFIDYPDTTHGFGSRPEGAAELAAFKQGHINAIEFFNKHG